MWLSQNLSCPNYGISLEYCSEVHILRVLNYILLMLTLLQLHSDVDSATTSF